MSLIKTLIIVFQTFNLVPWTNASYENRIPKGKTAVTVSTITYFNTSTTVERAFPTETSKVSSTGNSKLTTLNPSNSLSKSVSSENKSSSTTIRRRIPGEKTTVQPNSATKSTISTINYTNKDATKSNTKTVQQQSMSSKANYATHAENKNRIPAEKTTINSQKSTDNPKQSSYNAQKQSGSLSLTSIITTGTHQTTIHHRIPAGKTKEITTTTLATKVQP